MTLHRIIIFYQKRMDHASLLAFVRHFFRASRGRFFSYNVLDGMEAEQQLELNRGLILVQYRCEEQVALFFHWAESTQTWSLIKVWFNVSWTGLRTDRTSERYFGEVTERQFLNPKKPELAAHHDSSWTVMMCEGGGRCWELRFLASVMLFDGQLRSPGSERPWPLSTYRNQSELYVNILRIKCIKWRKTSTTFSTSMHGLALTLERITIHLENSCNTTADFTTIFTTKKKAKDWTFVIRLVILPDASNLT